MNVQPDGLQIIYGFILLSLLGLTAFALKKLTLTGAVLGTVIATCIFAGGGISGVLLLGLFFLGGTMATSYRAKQKQALGVATDNEAMRNAGQVFANGGVAAIAGLAAFAFPVHNTELQLMMAAALASATSDTFSSEFGNLYGKRFVNVLTFQRDTRGLDGVVSVEGTLFGIFGSMLIALVHALSEQSWHLFLSVFIAGIAGNFADSYLGALFERKQILTNNQVNLLNTVFAACTGLVVYLVML